MESQDQAPNPRRSRRINRRRLVGGAAGTAIALAASGYVKPDLRSLGVPGALAFGSSGPGRGKDKDKDKDKDKKKR